MSAPAANLVIAGVTKAGTTALLHYLAQHPDVCGERHKESQLLLTDGGPAGLAVAYGQQFAHCRGEAWRLESSPAYFAVGPELLARVQRPTEQVRVLIVLRNPTQRIWSGYRMKRDKGLLPPGSFDDFVRTGLHGAPTESDERLYRIFDTSRYATHLRPWLEALDDRCLVLFFEEFVTDTPGTLRTVCAWLDIDPAPIDDFDLSPHNRGVLHRNRGVHAAAAWGNRVLAVRLRRLPGLRSRLLRAYERLNAAEVDEVMSSSTRALLDHAYSDDIGRLRDLLADHGHARFPDWMADEPDTSRELSRRT